MSQVCRRTQTLQLQRKNVTFSADKALPVKSSGLWLTFSESYLRDLDLHEFFSLSWYKHIIIKEECDKIYIVYCSKHSPGNF